MFLPCNSSVTNYAPSVNVSLEYIPYEWPLNLHAVTATPNYPDSSVTVDVYFENDQFWDTLYCGPPFNYDWDLYLNHSPNTCDTDPPSQVRHISETMAPHDLIHKTFTIQGPHAGTMDIYAKLDGSDSLPLFFAANQCNYNSPETELISKGVEIDKKVA